MKRFLTTTAAALVLSTAAFGGEDKAPIQDASIEQGANLYASELIGKRVYATEAAITDEVPVAENGEIEWDDIGEINELVLTREGSVESVIIGVGGFIGIGEKDVAVDMAQLNIVSDGEEADEFFLVVNASAAGLETAPAYEREVDEDTAANAVDQDEVLIEPTVGDQANNDAGSSTLLTRPTIESEG